MPFPLCLETVWIKQRSFALYVPDKAAVQQAYQSGATGSIFWTRVWPAALALGGFLLDHPVYVKEKRVAELGAGLGLPSLVAASLAAGVWCTDAEPEAVETVALSAARNGAGNLQTAVVDWNHLPASLSFDILLLSDVNYDPEALPFLLQQMEGWLQQGLTILLSTPQRRWAGQFVSALLPHCRFQQERTVVQEGAQTIVSVLVLQASAVALKP